MKNTSSILSSQERIFLATIASQEKRIFHISDALSFWISEQTTRKKLSRLAKNGWIKRLKRGLYLLVPLEAGIDSLWTDDPLLIGTQLTSEGSVGYWTALHYWGMTEQIPRTVFIQTATQRSPSKEMILGTRYQFVSVIPNRYFGHTRQSSKGIYFDITDRERTVLDGLARPDLCGGILHIAKVIQSVEIFDWQKFDSYLQHFDSGALYKRLGYLIENLGMQIPEKENRISVWQSNLSQGITWLEPGGVKQGKINTRWNVRVNVSGLE